MKDHITYGMNGTGNTEEHAALSCIYSTRFRPVEQRLYWQVERVSLDCDRGRRWRGLSPDNRGETENSITSTRPSLIAPSAALRSCNGRASSLLRQWHTHTHTHTHTQTSAILLSKRMLLAQLWRSILSNLLFIYFKNSTWPFLPLCRHM